MKKYLVFTVAFLLVLSMGVGLASAQPGQHEPPAQKDTGNVIHVTAGESIQEAIDDASDGATIFVHEGTYEELLRIDGKDLRLVAVGDVVLKNADPAWTMSERTGVIEVSDSECTIEGFTIDVAGGYHGIYAYGGPYYGTGEVEITIKNNKIINYDRNGVNVNGKKATGKIMNNLVIGETDTGWANNGIQLGFGATGIIKGNTVKTNVWQGEEWTATGIMAFDTKNVRITKNTVKGSETGIFVIGTNNKVVNNKLVNGWAGIWIGSVDYYEQWHDLIYDGTNNKVISNTTKDYDYDGVNYGEETKVHANR